MEEMVARSKSCGVVTGSFALLFALKKNSLLTIVSWQVEEELEQLEKEIERQLAERQAKARGPWAKYARGECRQPFFLIDFFGSRWSFVSLAFVFFSFLFSFSLALSPSSLGNGGGNGGGNGWGI